jgi:hypothetical protein
MMTKEYDEIIGHLLREGAPEETTLTIGGAEHHSCLIRAGIVKPGDKIGDTVRIRVPQTYKVTA